MSKIESQKEIEELKEELKREKVLRKIAHQRIDRKSREMNWMKSLILEKEYELWIAYQEAKQLWENEKGTEYEDYFFKKVSNLHIEWALMKRFVQESSLEEEADEYHKDQKKSFELVQRDSK